MKQFIVALLMLTFASCQKEIETQQEFLTRTNQNLQPARMQDGDKLAVTVDMVFKPHTTFAYINRYDSINGQQILVDQDSFVIQSSAQQWTRNFKYTIFPYRGRIEVIVQDSLNNSYTKWMTLTNADGTVISYDTCSYAKSGWVGQCKILDAVPKHYQ